MRKNISVQKIGVEAPEIGGQKARGKKQRKREEQNLALVTLTLDQLKEKR